MTPRKIRNLSILFFSLALVALAMLFMIGSGTKQTETQTQSDAFAQIPTIDTTQVDLVTEDVKVTEIATLEPQATEVGFNYPDSFYITGITGHKQAYSLGCEAAAAVDWANYFGVSIIEYTFQVSLPHSDNPDYGFVGDVNSEWGQVPPFAYGVYSGPVADLLVQYGLPAKSVKGYTLDEVRQKLSESKPIIAWVIGRMVYSPPMTYIDGAGRSVVVAAYEHVVILTGYDVKANTIRFMSNGIFYDVPTQTFLTSWGVLGNMAVIHE